MKQLKHNILYVDDEETNLRVFASVYRTNYNIFTTTSAEEGLEILDKEKIDLIITDQRMPKMSGVQFLQEVQSRMPGVSPGRMIISGYSKTEEIEQAFKDHSLCMFVSKPYEVHDLKYKMERLISKCSSEDASGE